MGKCLSHSENSKSHERNAEQDNEQEVEQDQGERHEQYSERIDDLSSFLKRNTESLVLILDLRFGLLDVLVNGKLLTSEQVSLIQEKRTNPSRARQLRSRGSQFQTKTRNFFLMHLIKQIKSSCLTSYEATESVLLSMKIIGLYLNAKNCTTE
jgi:hypothetical protein